jgi:drug/metabolite transporter (DMT)-like permease
MLNAAAQILMRRGMLQTGGISFEVGALRQALPVMLKSGLLWMSVLCYGISLFLWMIVLSRVEVSFAYAFSSLGYALVAVMGAVFLGEHISIPRIAGIAVVCLGVLLISKG